MKVRFQKTHRDELIVKHSDSNNKWNAFKECRYVKNIKLGSWSFDYVKHLSPDIHKNE